MDNMTIAEKVSYIKGLTEGMKIDTATNEGKVLAAILDVLGDIALNIEDIDSDLADLTASLSLRTMSMTKTATMSPMTMTTRICMRSPAPTAARRSQLISTLSQTATSSARTAAQNLNSTSVPSITRNNLIKTE